MDNVILLSKFKNNLGNVISDYKNNINEIEEKEQFLQKLSDLVNYSKSDATLLPFYDEELLKTIIENIFPIYTSNLNKIKTAKYLIESSKNIDKNNFPQYNHAIIELTEINNDIIKHYEDIMNNNNYNEEKENYNAIIEKYSKLYEAISEEKFTNLIEDIDLFEEIINKCNLTNEEINTILNIAIKSNLEILEDDGIIEIEIEENNKIKEATQNLSDLINSSL